MNRPLLSTLTAALFAGIAVSVFAQVPRPAQSSEPKPAAAGTPRPAEAGKPAQKKSAPASAAKPAPKDTPVSYNIGLPQLMPPLARLPSPAVEKLSNGMKLAVFRDARLPVVDVALLIPVGYRNDPPGKRGLTGAVAQAMRYGGTLDKTGPDVEAYLQERAIALQALVGPELTLWTFRCRSEYLSDALALLTEIFTKPAFRRDAIERYTLQLLREIQTRGQDLDVAADQEAESAVFGPDSPWSRKYNYSDVRAITRESIMAHFQKTIVPAQSVIGLNGDVDPAAARELLGRTLGGWTSATPPATPPAAPPVPSRRLTVLDKPNALDARLVLALPFKHRAVERTPREAAALALLAAQLEPVEESQMESLMRPFLNTGANVRLVPGLGLNDVPLLRMIALLRPREAIDGTVALWKELQAIRTAKVAPAKLEAAKRSVLRKTSLQAASSTSRFYLAMEAIALGASPAYLENFQQAVNSMNPADYEQIIKEQLNLDAAQFVLTGDDRDYRSSPDTAGFPVVRASAAPPPPPPAAPVDESASRTSALQLLADVQKAMGGAERLAAIRDATWHYEAKLIRASPPIVVTQRNSWLEPAFYRQEQTSGIGSGVAYYDGKMGWSNSSRGPTPLTPAFAMQYRNEVTRLLFRLVRAGEMEGYKVAYAGSGVVKITAPDTYQVELAVNFQTNLPERLRFIDLRPNDNVTFAVEEQLSDYKSVDGVLMPHRIFVKQNGQDFADFTMTEMRFNTGLTAGQMGKRP